MNWEVVIGLEDARAAVDRSKIFSSASTAFGAEPNSQACVVDIALPGVLPVLNRGAVERAIRFGLAVGATISPQARSSRARTTSTRTSRRATRSVSTSCRSCGAARDDSGRRREKTVNLTRAHLEEDAGKSLHEDFHGMTGIDLNRAGTPLLEIVTEPEMRSSAEAVAYAKALHALVQWIGICDGNMQEGSFRCDANVSVRPRGFRQARHPLRDQEPQLLPLPASRRSSTSATARSS
jgi:aspartyl-tRNA(Asn)/glutamyl-tRNA(Gln) amidotransferase subunit B